jgi:hypothetical protein
VRTEREMVGDILWRSLREFRANCLEKPTRFVLSPPMWARLACVTLGCSRDDLSRELSFSPVRENLRGLTFGGIPVEQGEKTTWPEVVVVGSGDLEQYLQRSSVLNPEGA